MIRPIVFCALIYPIAGLADTCAEILEFAANEADVPFEPDRAKCTSSMALGGAISQDCAWPFDYRSDTATAFFESILVDLNQCGQDITKAVPGVSHPDSYDLRQFVVESAIISVSLKDKGALSETYVFFRAAARNP